MMRQSAATVADILGRGLIPSLFAPIPCSFARSGKQPVEYKGISNEPKILD